MAKPHRMATMTIASIAGGAPGLAGYRDSFWWWSCRWGKLLGRHKIAPIISPNKTWEGFVGGVLSATALGTLLWWATPFAMWHAAAMALVITVMGFLGGLTMSAIKRDAGVKDYGAMIEGHGGVLDRIDSLCFAGPIFFHLTRYFFS